MLKKTTEWLEVHKSKETSSVFFDTVIFCTNVTYADGHFKGGKPIFPSCMMGPLTIFLG